MDKYTMMDLHTHSCASDGTLTPSELVKHGFARGLSVMAVTDHDSISGVEEAVQEGNRLGLCVIPGVELATQFRCELHILGLNIDIHHSEFILKIKQLSMLREKRNYTIIEKLAAAGFDVRKSLGQPVNQITRLNIAIALWKNGYAESLREAFANFLAPGMVGHVPFVRIRPAKAIQIIRTAGGIPVLAHPCKIRADMRSVVSELVKIGLGGIEAYYPSSTPEQTEFFKDLAKQYGLVVTCGSDFHGDNRHGVELGCAWQNASELANTVNLFKRNAGFC